jgi:hypothetical protein
MIAEALFKLQKDVLENVSAIHLTKSLPVIRNRSVGWLSKAYHAVNDPVFVKKVCMLSLLWSVLIAAWLIFILF